MLVTQFSLRDVAVLESLTGSDELARFGVEATVSVDLEAGSVEFRAGGQGTWSVSGDVDELGWPQDDPVDGITTERLVERWHDSGFVGAACVQLVVHKDPWSAPIAQETSGAVWIGHSLKGFVRWVEGRHPDDSLGALLERGAGLVLLLDWTAEATDLGPNLTIGAPETRPAAPPVTPEWPGEGDGWRRRAFLVELDGCPDSLRGPLLVSIGWAAATLLGEEVSRSSVRPDRDSITRWHLPATHPDVGREPPAVVLLARWVSAEATTTRLAIARKVAATRLDHPIARGGGELLEAAEIAYRQTIDSTVQAALGRQVELEQSFRSVDSELSTVRANLLQALDQTVLRAIVGLIATAAAAITTEEKSATFVLSGSLLVAVYVLFSATVELAVARRDAEARITAFESIVHMRGGELAAAPLATLHAWRRQIRRRARWMRWLLVAIAASIACGGALTAAAIDEPPNRSTSEQGIVASSP